MNSPLISIIIPIYNVEAYLRECLNSVIAQTYPNWECIMVDDASTDGSAAIAEEFCAKDSRFRLLRNRENQGLSVSRNRGLDAAEGSLLTFIDSDDYISPKFLASCSLLIDSDIDIVSSDFRKGVHEAVLSGREAVCYILYQRKGVNASACAKIFRREIFEGVRFMKDCTYEDLDIIDRLVLKAKNVSIVAEQMYFYRQRRGSILHTWDCRRLDVLAVTERIEARMAGDEELLRAARDRRFAANFNMLLLMRKNGLRKSEEAEGCRAQIRRLRRQVLFDSRSRLKNRIGALLAYVFI